MGGVVFFAYQRNVDFWSCFVRVTEMVLVDTSTGLHSDDVISRLKEWRVAGLISQDISIRPGMSTRRVASISVLHH